MSLINSVRNTVLAIANKNNYGYISPQDFNLYAKQAQMDMFEDYFYSYNNWINRENSRTSGTGYADIIKGLEEVIDTFSVQAFLTPSNPVVGTSGLSGTNVYNLPSDYYLINKLFRFPNLKTVGSMIPNPLAPNTLTDPAADFLALGIQPNDIVVSLDPTGITPYPETGYPGLEGLVRNLQNPSVTTSQLEIDGRIFPNPLGLPSLKYAIYGPKIVEVERVTHAKIHNLLMSNLTYPKPGYPCYVLDGNQVTVYPHFWDGLNIPFTPSTTYLGVIDVKAQYIRYPKAPQWTFVTLSGGEPLFNQSNTSYQDFELPLSDEPALVAKICQYVGIEIREAEVVEFGLGEERVNTQETS
tara:strand:+ start:509 stop:1573 length:1065 start_codon:yes stop_codon:yes gene_type:complete